MKFRSTLTLFLYKGRHPYPLCHAYRPIVGGYSTSNVGPGRADKRGKDAKIMPNFINSFNLQELTNKIINDTMQTPVTHILHLDCAHSNL